MKRRKFVESLLSTSALAPAAFSAQQPAPPASAQQPNTPARQLPQQPPQQDPAQLSLTQPDLVSETEQHFFSAEQFAGLRKLAGLLVPPLKGKPGALEARAPEFLDFLLSVSPADRQTIYRSGLDGLNVQARERYQKSFSALDSSQADAIVRPLLIARFWPQDLPADPMQSFLAQAHDDLRTATTNSREWAAAGGASSGSRRFNRGRGLYWHPIDPVVRS